MCRLTNTEVLCFVMSWQGGTLEQVQLALCVPARDILEADAQTMGDLCRRAQVYRRFSEGKASKERP